MPLKGGAWRDASMVLLYNAVSGAASDAKEHDKKGRADSLGEATSHRRAMLKVGRVRAKPAPPPSIPTDEEAPPPDDDLRPAEEKSSSERGAQVAEAEEHA